LPIGTKLGRIVYNVALCTKEKYSPTPVVQSLPFIYILITPYIRILDFDWLIAGVFFVYYHI
jgi:hypothetical protein